MRLFVMSRSRPETFSFSKGTVSLTGQDESPLGSGRPINLASQRRNATPFPEYLGTLFGGRREDASITASPETGRSTALSRWKNANGGDIYFIMYGTNDAGNFAQLPGGPLSVNQYTQNLEAMTTRRLRDGAEVVVLLPPPVIDPGFDAVLQAFREAARDVAGRLGLTIIDTPTVLAPVAERSVWTEYTCPPSRTRRSPPPLKALSAMRREFFVNVQILRLIAASLVVIIHFQDLFPHTQSLNYIFRYGYAGVDLFFVISGFIMVVTTAHQHPSAAIVLPQPDLQSCPALLARDFPGLRHGPGRAVLFHKYINKSG